MFSVGRKAEKKKSKNPHVQELTDKQKNPKAFTFNSAVRAERRFRRFVYYPVFFFMAAKIQFS